MTTKTFSTRDRARIQSYRVWFKKQPVGTREIILKDLQSEHEYLLSTELPTWCDFPLVEAEWAWFLSVRAANVIEQASRWGTPVRTTRELIVMSHARVMREVKSCGGNCGKKTIREMVAKLAEYYVAWPPEGSKLVPL
jgi:hypothetical protein